MSQSSVRAATHAGSWYSDDPNTLAEELNGYVNKTRKLVSSVKAIIVPHAGYRYAGHTAAYSFRHLECESIKRVVILGPSHHKYIEGCALPAKDVTTYATPLGNIPLDTEAIEQLRGASGQGVEFESLPLADDQNEHSIEMMLPFLHHTMAGCDYKIVPIVVGVLNTRREEQFGKLMYPLFQDPKTVFVVSSDFCHWGKRFRYTYIKPDCTSMRINEAIEHLDRTGIHHIERQDPTEFEKYLRIHGNTICGRHAIAIYLNILKQAPAGSFVTKFIHYSQSGPVNGTAESCVAYASIVTTAV